MLLTKKYFFIFTLTFLWALLAIQKSQAEDIANRATLTQAALELQRDLLIAQEKHLNKERTGLHVYLNFNHKHPTSSKPGIITISINISGQQVLNRTFDMALLTNPSNNGMQNLGSIALPEGKHKLSIQFNAGKRNTTKTITLEKSTGRDNLKITITKPLQQRNPGVVFEHKKWKALQ